MRLGIRACFLGVYWNFTVVVIQLANEKPVNVFDDPERFPERYRGIEMATRKGNFSGPPLIRSPTDRRN